MMWDFLASLISPVTNFIGGLFTNKTNKQNVSDTNAANMAMNQANINFQKEENQIARQREDNAVQRRASDLTAAGLSKTLAAGSPASANAMNAPNNSFASQPFKAEAPRFDWDYAAVKQNLASADAARQNAETQSRLAQVEEDKFAFEEKKWNEQHTYDVSRTEWEHEFEENKFAYDKSIRERTFALQKAVDFANISLDRKKYLLDKKELGLKRVQLMDDLKNSLSQRDYRDFEKSYYATMLEISKHEDVRAQNLLAYNIVQMKANVSEALSKVKLNSFQGRLVKQQCYNTAMNTIAKYCEANHLKAETRYTLEKLVSEVFDRSVAEAEGTTTSGNVVGSSAAAENKSRRHVDLAQTAISVGGHIALGVGLAFAGGNRHVRSTKEFDHTEWYKDL